MSVLAQVLCRKHAAAGQRNETARDASDKYHLSQHANRDVAWKILRSRLYEVELEKREAAREEVEAGKKDIAFGSQIRSYVLAPYRLVKDHRTGAESGNVDAVLDGAIEEFITAQLMGIKNPNRGPPEA